MVGTYIKKVTVGENTVHVPQFSCEKCGDGQVPLVPKSGLFPKYDKESKTWSLKLRDDDEYPPVMAAMMAAKKASGELHNPEPSMASEPVFTHLGYHSMMYNPVPYCTW